MHTGHSFVRSNADWDRIKQTFGTAIIIIIIKTIIIIIMANISTYINRPNFSNGVNSAINNNIY